MSALTVFLDVMNAKYETLQERETFSLRKRDILTFSIERPRSSVLKAASSKRSDSKMFRRQFKKKSKENVTSTLS